MHFLRLIRPVNLLVIALTMYSVRLFFVPYMESFEQTHGTFSLWESIDYFLLVFSTIIIAAGGNIINDYFDVKADKVNKPHKVIIGKYIKPRWAIVTHWLLNFIAFAIACYLSFKHDTFWYVFIHLFSINALWFYSMYFKRKFFIGNLLIAALTGLVPILSGIYFLDITEPYQSSAFNQLMENNESWINVLNLKIFFVVFFALFATALNLVREMVKDIEDVEGDKLLHAKTLPIVLGISKTKWIASALLFTFFLLPIPFMFEAYELYQLEFIYAFAPAILIVLLWIISIFLLLGAKERLQFKRIGLLLKIIMVIGCCMPIYWYFLA